MTSQDKYPQHRKDGTMTKALILKFKQNPPELPAPPIAEIIVGRSMKDENCDDIILTPRCLSFHELNLEVDRLIKQLEDIRKEAKKKFDKAR
jgi:hypothetical protein